MKRNNLYCFCFFQCILFFLSSCGEKVTITRSYIHSTGWEKGEYQGFRIAKIKLLDSSISVYDKNFNRLKLDEHNIDSSFCFIESTETNSRDLHEKIYFGEENIKRKWRRCWNGVSDVRKTIGLLELDTWYIILELKGTIDYYVFIDKEGGAHTYSIGPANW